MDRNRKIPPSHMWLALQFLLQRYTEMYVLQKRDKIVNRVGAGS